MRTVVDATPIKEHFDHFMLKDAALGKLFSNSSTSETQRNLKDLSQ